MNKLKRVLASIAAFGMLLSSVPTVAAMGFKDVSDDNNFAPYIDHGVDKGYFSGANEYFYPNNNLTRGELAKIASVGAGLTEDTTKGPHFDDVAEDDTFYTYVETLVNKGALSINKNFRPNDKVTRAEATKILVMAFGFEIDTTGGPSFSDVAADNTFYSYIETAANNGLVNGYEDGTFGPYKNITRAEASKILAMATGYTGTWGEAAGVALTLSADSVDVGGTLTITAKAVDADGNVVADYDGTAQFSVSTGNISDKDVELVRGQAKVTYTAPGYGAEGTVTVKLDKYTAEAKFTVVIPQDQKMMIYATDYNIGTTDSTVLYMTVSDDKGIPVTGLTNDLTFDVTEGDATLGDVAQFPGGAKGVYRVVMNTNNAAIGANVIEATNNKTGDKATVSVEVAPVNVQVYLLDSAISIKQTTTALVYLTKGDGSPITDAVTGSDLTIGFLNSKHGSAGTVTAIGDGWYSSLLTANAEVAATKVKVSYTGTTPNVHNYVDLEIAPFNISMEIVNKDINSLTGVTPVIFMITDVNGNPVDLDMDGAGPDTGLISPVTDLSFDVITSAVYASPTGNTVWTDLLDWYYSFAGANGVLTTQISACGVDSATCNIDDNSIEIIARLKAATNKVVEVRDTFAITHPTISESQAFVANNAQKEVHTLTKAVASNGGAFVADNVITVVVDGTSVNYTVAAADIVADNTVLFTNLVAAINANTTVSAKYVASVVDKNTLSITNVDFGGKSFTLSASKTGTAVTFTDATTIPLISDAVLVVTVLDGKGAGVTGLNAEDGANSHFLLDSAEVATADVDSIGGGVYVIDTGLDYGTDLTVGLTLANTDVHDVTVSKYATSGDSVIFGDNSIAEGAAAINAATENRSGLVYARVAAGKLSDVGPLDVTAETPVNVVDTGVGSDLSATVGIYGHAVQADAADQIETSTVTVPSSPSKTTTFSVRPIKVKHVSVDTNGKAVKKIYGYLKSIDLDERLVDTHAISNITVNTEGGADDAEANGANIALVQTTGGVTLGGLYGVQYDRAIGNDNTGESATVEYQLNNDDASLYISNWVFDIVNPTYEVYTQNSTTYVAPNSDIGGTFEADNAITILAVARDDQMVATDLPMGNLTAEVKTGDGLLDIDLLAGTRTDTQPMSPIAPAGVYTINYIPEKDAEVLSVVNIYPSWDDNDESQALEFSVEYPQGQVVIFPTKIDPDKQNNESAVLTVVRDSFGNPINNLVVAAGQDLAVEIEGNQQLTDSSVNGTNNTIYFGKYTTDKVGTQKVEVKYNDDEPILTTEVVVEMAK